VVLDSDKFPKFYRGIIMSQTENDQNVLEQNGQSSLIVEHTSKPLTILTYTFDFKNLQCTYEHWVYIDKCP